MTTEKICIVIPYFGQWPSWMAFFVESVRKNPSIDWLIHTDCGELNDKPDNIRLVHTTFAAYQEKISACLGINFTAYSPYKLCDLKPVYGLIHEQELVGYDFWGFGDIDVIYGDLRGYLTPEMLRHNLISFHGNRISGHLCLLKNTQEMRTAFRQAKNWQAILSDPQHRCFDEKGFNEIFIRHRNWPTWLRRLVFFPRYFMRTAFFQESYSTSFGSVPWIDGSFRFPREWMWNNGLLMTPVAGRHSFPYLHFLHWKRYWAKDKQMDANPKQAPWIINEDGFFGAQSMKGEGRGCPFFAGNSELQSAGITNPHH